MEEECSPFHRAGDASVRSIDSADDSHQSKRRRAHASFSADDLLPTPTEEQQQILEMVQLGCSFRVVANAGAGKTKTLLRAAASLEKKVLFLAYNRDIKEEVQLLAASHGLSLVDVENYDSLLVNYYDNKAASQDFQLSLQKVLEAGDAAKPLQEMCWEAIFIDEAQDVDEDYLRFIHKILVDNALPGAAQVVSVGDAKQTIFKYRGANAEFFMKLGIHPADSLSLKLSVTFRFGREVCAFVDAVCAPLFPLDYFGHVSGAADSTGGVEHWVLSGKPLQRHDALLERLQQLRRELEGAGSQSPEKKLLAFLSGSKKEGNDVLWSFVEEIGCSSAQHTLVVEDASHTFVNGSPLAFVRNIHCCKGKTFEVAVLFLTTRRSWISQGTGSVEKETLYVALTRSRRLLIVECDDTLIFQEILEQSLGSARESVVALPNARCASSGAFRTPPLEKQQWGAARSFCKPFLAERVAKLRVRAKKELLDLVDAPSLSEWDSEITSDASSKDSLQALAAWIRVEHDLGEEKSKFNDFFRALRKPFAEKAYAQLWRSRRQHPIAPHLQRRLVDLAKREVLTAADYLEAARLHSIFQYGYLALPERTPLEEERSHVLFLSLRNELRRLEEPQKIYEVRFEKKNLKDGRDVAQATMEHGLYLANNVVVMLKAETVSAESLNDRLLAAFVASKLGADSYEICYVPLDQSKSTRRVEGRVDVTKRTRYVATFERAVEDQ